MDSTYGGNGLMGVYGGTTLTWNQQEIQEDVGFFASGGTVTEITQDGIVYRVHTFTNVGVSTLTTNRQLNRVEYLVVAGGASGGGNATTVGGRGGGAGGFRTSVRGATSGRNSPAEPQLRLDPQEYTVTVGGASQDSTFHTITSLRGGVGCGNGGTASSGGSIGYGGAGTAGQGYNGGAGLPGSSPLYRGAGAGGGAGGAGANGSWNAGGGPGGAGLKSSITGTEVTYARGGNFIGARIYFSYTGASGAANSGNGGGGGNPPGTGGSGIVIVRYPIGVVGQ